MRPSRDGTADLFEAIYSQRAIRYFAPDQVPDDLLWQVIEAATKAPSASNNQAWRFVIVRDDARRSAIAALLREVAPEGSPLVQRAMDGSKSSDRTIRLMRSGVLDLVRDLDHAPVFIIPCVYPAPDPAARGIRAGGSIYGAIQNLQLAARGLGLGTVLTGFDGIMGLWPHQEETCGGSDPLPGMGSAARSRSISLVGIVADNATPGGPGHPRGRGGVAALPD